MDPNQQLRDHLEQLREDAAELNAVDEATKRRISELVDQIEQQIDSPSDGTRHNGLVEKLNDALEHFETDHPRITDTLNRIMVALGV